MLRFVPAPKEGALEGVPPLDPTDRPEYNDLPYGAEQRVLASAIDGLQYERWGKFEPEFLPEQAEVVRPYYADRIETMTTDAYGEALGTLVGRFGADFFREAAWDSAMRHLQGIHSKEMTLHSPYRTHADIEPLGQVAMAAAKIVTNNAHPLPKAMDGGFVANAWPLYGDPDFWKVLERDHTDTLDELVDRWLVLPRDDERPGRYNTAITVHPPALLKQHFTEAYDALTAMKHAHGSPAFPLLAKPYFGDIRAIKAHRRLA